MKQKPATVIESADDVPPPSDFSRGVRGKYWPTDPAEAYPKALERLRVMQGTAMRLRDENERLRAVVDAARELRVAKRTLDASPASGVNGTASAANRRYDAAWRALNKALDNAERVTKTGD